MLKIDGVTYNGVHVVPPISRSFSVTDGENAGRLALSGKMIRDIIGTFYNYSFEIDAASSDPAEYDQFYGVISAPQDFHTIEVPYGQETLVFEAYITTGSDECAAILPGRTRWSNLKFNAIAMEPQRKPT